jgi:hypothetical protein
MTLELPLKAQGSYQVSLKSIDYFNVEMGEHTDEYTDLRTDSQTHGDVLMLHS